MLTKLPPLRSWSKAPDPDYENRLLYWIMTDVGEYQLKPRRTIKSNRPIYSAWRGNVFISNHGTAAQAAKAAAEHFKWYWNTKANPRRNGRSYAVKGETPKRYWTPGQNDVVYIEGVKTRLGKPWHGEGGSIFPLKPPVRGTTAMSARNILQVARVEEGKGMESVGSTTNPSAIRAQVRRLPSGEVQIKVPLKRGENPMAKARELAKALGRKITSVSRVGNPHSAKAYWQYPWSVVVDSGSVGITTALSRGFNTEDQARAYIQKLKARSLHLGRAIKLLHNTGTNAPGGVKVVSSKSY